MQFLTELENYLNSLVQKLFPVWYITQAARELQLQPIGILNPSSFLSHRWMSLHSVLQSLDQSLTNQDGDWKELQELLGKLLVEKEYPRRLSITAINGVEQSQHIDDWPSLLAYAENNPNELVIEGAEDFDAKLHEAFPNENKPHRVVYREWDGRYYWINPTEPDLLAALQMYAQENDRDASISALINVESINSSALDRIRNDWWLLIVAAEQANYIHRLAQDAQLPIAKANFEWRRDDLHVLVARKNDPRINKIFLSLINKRSTQDVLEFGGWLSRHHFPFRNK